MRPFVVSAATFRRAGDGRRTYDGVLTSVLMHESAQEEPAGPLRTPGDLENRENEDEGISFGTTKV